MSKDEPEVLATERPKRLRGFAAMNKVRQLECASLGGKAAQARCKSTWFEGERAREAGRKGGVTIGQDREHMARIGRRGGLAACAKPGYMAELGRKGGEVRRARRDKETSALARWLERTPIDATTCTPAREKGK